VPLAPARDEVQGQHTTGVRLSHLHAELTADVLKGGPAEGTTGARLDAWMAANAPPVERCMEILGDIRAAGSYDLTTLPVALREVRNLIQSTTPVAGNGAGTRPAAAAAVTRATGRKRRAAARRPRRAT
jgi:hypothetical protein